MFLLRPKKDIKVSAKVSRKCSAYSLILLRWLDPDGYFAGMPYGSKISLKSLYLARIFVFCDFCEKFENSKFPPYLARQKLFENWDGYTPERYPVDHKSRRNLTRFLRYKHFCVLQFLQTSKLKILIT